jgi:hypothetical protein
MGEPRPRYANSQQPAAAVWVPDAAHEAMRDLVRARLDAVQALRRARQ